MTRLKTLILGNLLAELQADIHRTNRAKGFYDDLDAADPRHLVSILALIMTEVSEAIEAVRRDPDAPCDKPIPLTAEEEEWADVFIRLLDYAGLRGIEAGRVVQIKSEYNKTRSFKHGGCRC